MRKSAKKKSAKKRSPIRGYDIFLRKFTKKYMKKQNVTAKEAFLKAVLKWKQLSEKEKEKYNDQAYRVAHERALLTVRKWQQQSAPPPL